MTTAPVAFIVPTLRGGGVERLVSRLSQHAAQSRPVTVITWDGRVVAYPIGGELVDLGLPSVVTWPGKWLRQRARSRVLAQALRERGIRHAIAFMEAAGVPLMMAKRRWVPDMHVTMSLHNAPYSLPRTARWLIQKWYPMADRIVVSTEAARSTMTAWGIPANRCDVVPYPLSDDWLAPVKPLPGRTPGSILAIGRLEAQKDFPLLLQALSALPSTSWQRCTIVGEGSQRDSLLAQVRTLGLGGRVDLPGWSGDVHGLLDRARVFVLSSRHEGFPNVLAEAMARGCPVVSTRCPTGPDEMIGSSRAGWLVPVGDAAALATGIREALQDDRQAAERAAMARTRAEAWAIDRIAPRWLNDS